MSIQPIRNWILVEPFECDGISTGGIIVPNSFKEPSSKCKVVAVGQGTAAKKMQFKKDDIVFRVLGHGEPIQENGKEYLMMDQNTVLAFG